MRAVEGVLSVEGGEVGGGVRGDVVCDEGGRGGGGGEGAADDLLDGAGVEVDAGAEEGHFGGEGGWELFTLVEMQ